MKISIWFQNKPRSFIGLSMSDKKLLKNCNRALCTLSPDTSFIRGYFYLLIVRYVFNKGNPSSNDKVASIEFPVGDVCNSKPLCTVLCRIKPLMAAMRNAFCLWITIAVLYSIVLSGWTYWLIIWMVQ